ncbi:ABC transporter permease [Microbacterium trichothecenolyticum]|uniref:ABC transporter permease n=1 Tax=Microbacterium ureisolvens TaxID=2781186 RepID=A0ABS7I017_9MICO|nr:MULTISPECIES: ABC transporter permease [Microbacterium]MBW9110449.1 ABC transporter permease [Microbacterium ureisolvens]MBW9120554.1 ABC transporter permease [Microbacterium trichothecenolyticum]
MAQSESTHPKSTHWEGGAPSRPATVRRFLGRAASLWTFGILLMIVIGFALTTNNFFSKAGWQAISLNSTEVLLIAIGGTFVIVAGGIDLSVGSVLALSGIVSAMVMSSLVDSQRGAIETMIIGLMVALAVGAGAGAVNGLIITGFNVSPFIVTLGMLGVARGLTQLANGGQEVSNLPPELVVIGNSFLLDGWIAVPVAVTIVAAFTGWLFLAKTRFGRRIKAIGSNSQAATRTGIKVKRYLLLTYILSGLMAGLAGFSAMSQLGVATITAGQGIELAAVAAIVIGGTSLYGGRGSVAGTVVGALIVAVLETGLIIARANSAWQIIVVGIILIGAVLVDRQRARVARSE